MQLSYLKSRQAMMHSPFSLLKLKSHGVQPLSQAKKATEKVSVRLSQTKLEAGNFILTVIVTTNCFETSIFVEIN